MDSEEHKRVFVFGAGASHDSEPYSVNGDEPESSKHPPLLADILDTAQRAKFSRFDNVEDILTFLQISIERAESPAEREETVGQVRELQTSIVKVLRDSCCKIRSRNYEEFCASLLRPKDTILTFNWDDLLDKALAALGKGLPPYKQLDRGLQFGHRTEFGAGLTWFGYIELEHYQIVGEDSSGFYFKLHGSISWFRCIYEDCRGKGMSFVDTKLGGERYWQDALPDCPLCGRKLVRLLVPPSFVKRINVPQLDVTWNLAAKELNAADEIAFIGYSFPASDYYSQWLFKSPLSRRLAANTLPILTVVDPCDAVPDRIGRILNIPVSSRYKKFSDYVSSQSRSGT